MELGAAVESLETLREWHAHLTTFRIEALDCLAAIQLAIRKCEDYLTDMQRIWQGRAREFYEEVVQARAELARKEIPRFDGRMPDTTVEQENLREAKNRLEHAEEQLEIVKKWQIKLQRAVSEVYDGPGRRFHNFLEVETLRGLTGLARQIGSLQSYVDQHK